MSQPMGPGGLGGGPPATPHKGASIVTYKAELRKAIRRNAHEHEVNFLNITAMLDIMTIILVFLLKTPAQEGVLVTVSKTQILVGDDKILTLPGRESLAQAGVDARFKRSGPNDLFIVPLGNALMAARKTDVAVRRAKGLDPSSSEAIVIADKGTPYRLLMEVLFTLGQSEYGKYHLMVMQSKTLGG
jgi:biopolymer transport protein ExbD